MSRKMMADIEAMKRRLAALEAEVEALKVKRGPGRPRKDETPDD